MTSREHRLAGLQALLVTFLWSTSWVLIKLGLGSLPPLTFAGLRYGLATLALLPFALRAGRGLHISRGEWGRLLLLGVLLYAITQGAQFLGLAFLPAVTVSLLYNLTSPLVAFMGLALLHERPTGLQWAGLALFLAGVLIYFYPNLLPVGALPAILVVLAGVLANSLSAVLGRAINREGRLPPLVVTAVSMGVGAALLLAGGLGIHGLPSLGWREALLLAWLALINTAFAFTLWNQTQKILPAMESSLINGTMLIQIAVLAWVFLGETLTWQTGLALGLAAGGALLSQWRSPAGRSLQEVRDEP